MTDISTREMFQYLVGEVTRVRADEIDAHLAACHSCQTELDGLRGMIELMDEPDEELESVDLVPEVRKMIEIDSEKPRQHRRSLPAAVVLIGALLVAVAAVTIWTGFPEEREIFRAKSSGTMIPEQDRWVALRAYRLGESGQTGRLSTGMKNDDFLLFAYTNLGEQTKRYLMIFAVDARGKVHWYHPGYTSAESDPASMPIESNVTSEELPEKIRHDYSAGPLWIYSLFTDQPMKVSAVEAMISGLRPGERIPVEDSAQHILKTVVEP